MENSLHQVSQIILRQGEKIKSYTERKANIVRSSTLFAVNGIINSESRKNLDMNLENNSELGCLSTSDMNIENYMELKTRELFGDISNKKKAAIDDTHKNQLKNNTYSHIYYHSEEKYIAVFCNESNYLTRKIIFEHFLLKYIDNFSPFRGLKYDQNIDYIFRNMAGAGDNIFAIHIKSIKEKLNNKSEVRKFFQIYGLLLNDNVKNRNNFELISDTLKIVTENRENLKYLDEEVLLRILGKKSQTIDTYHNHDRLYARIPSTLSSNHGENNAALDFLSEFIKSHRPSTLKVAERQKNLSDSIFKDAENFKTVQHYIENIKKMGRTSYSVAKKKVEPITRYIGDTYSAIKEQSSEKIFTCILQLIRDERNIKTQISEEEHKNLLLQFISIRKYEESIKKSQKINQAHNAETRKSSTLNFIQGRLQVKILIPVINALGKVKTIALISKSIKIIKIKNALWIGVYITIDKISSLLSSLPVFRRYSLIERSYNGYGLESNPELMAFYIKNAGTIEDIGKRVINLKELRKLRKLERKLSSYELDLVSLQEDREISQSSSLGTIKTTDLRLETLGKDISLLKLKIKGLKNELDVSKSSGEVRDSIKGELSAILESTQQKLHSPLVQN